MKISTYPDEVLLTKTTHIDEKDINQETFTQIGSRMLKLMRSKGGVGLAANQVGLKFRMCVIEISHNETYIMLNPYIVYTSGKIVLSPQGCLSIPNAFGKTKRFEEVGIEYQEVTGEVKTLTATGLLSYCIQHEIDHLDGKVIFDRMNNYNKSLVKKRMKLLNRKGN